MPNIAINLQHEEWEDDGGAHDPFVIDLDALRVIDATLADVMTAAISDPENIPMITRDSADTLNLDSVRASFPCMVDAAFAVWFA